MKKVIVILNVYLPVIIVILGLSYFEIINNNLSIGISIILVSSTIFFVNYFSKNEENKFNKKTTDSLKENALVKTRMNSWIFDYSINKYIPENNWYEAFGLIKENYYTKDFYDDWVSRLGKEEYNRMLDKLIAFKTNDKKQFEFYFSYDHPNYGIRYYYAYGEPYEKNEKGEIISLAGINIDITDITLANKKVKNKSAYLQSLINTTQTAFIRVNNEGFILEFNPALENLLETDRNELLNKPLSDYLTNRSKETLNEQLNKRMNNKKSEYELEFIKNDKIITCIVSASPIEDENGLINESFGWITDISAKKSYEKKLKENEEKYRSLFDSFLMGVVIFNEKLGIIDANKSATNILGINFEESPGSSLEMFKGQAFHPNGEELLYEEFPAYISAKTGENVVEREMLIYKNKEAVFLSVNAIYINAEKIKIAVVFENITNKKETEIKLEKNRANLISIINNTNAYIWSIDINRKLIVANDNVKNVVNKHYETEIKNNYSNLENLPDVISEKLKDAYDYVLQGNIYSGIEYNLPGLPEILGITISPVYMDKKIIGLSCFAHDITSIKKNEDNMRKSKEWLQSIIDSIDTSIIVRNKNDELILSNKAYQNLIVSLKEISGENIYSELLSKIEETDRNVFKNNEIFSFEFSFKKNNEDVFLHISKIPLQKNNNSNCFVLTHIFDLSSIKKYEKELEKYSEELKSFNNLMLNREMRIIEVKKEVNNLLKKLGKEPKYEAFWE